MPTPIQLRKALLDAERAKYEKAYGPVRSPGEMLQLVLGNEHFAWLRPYSGLIVRIDEWLADDDASPAEADAFWNEAIVLTTPSAAADETAGGRYRLFLDEVPKVATGHAAIRAALGRQM